MHYTDGTLGKDIKPKKDAGYTTPSAQSVIDAIRPLAEFYRVNNRKVDRIAVDAAMWRRVEAMADDPKDGRIVRHMDGYPMYGVYELYRLEK